MANITEETVILKPGQTIGRFRPLHRDCGKVSLFDSTDEGKQFIVNNISERSDSTSQQPGWKSEVRADYSRLTEEQIGCFNKLLDCNADVFVMNNGDLGKTNLIEHGIDTQQATPIKQAPRRLPPFKREEVDEQVKSSKPKSSLHFPQRLELSQMTSLQSIMHSA